MLGQRRPNDDESRSGNKFGEKREGKMISVVSMIARARMSVSDVAATTNLFSTAKRLPMGRVQADNARRNIGPLYESRIRGAGRHVISFGVPNRLLGGLLGPSLGCSPL